MGKLKRGEAVQGIDYIGRSLFVDNRVGKFLVQLVEHHIDKMVTFGQERILDISLKSQRINSISGGKGIGIETQGVPLVVVLYASTKVERIGSMRL